ncbi:MAG: hypothetical protein HYS13_14865 [Planctomycetia bacterium]|nr:hypothetical protein [Planctomycetia bacterium]
MKRTSYIVAAAALTACVAAVLAAAPFASAEDKVEEEYIRVEVKGVLQTGIFAIGGETTGVIIKAGKVTWELDLAGDKELIALAEKLDKKTVVVTGDYTQKQGVEVRVRHIVKVKTLKEAEAK